MHRIIIKLILLYIFIIGISNKIYCHERNSSDCKIIEVAIKILKNNFKGKILFIDSLYNFEIKNNELIWTRNQFGELKDSLSAGKEYVLLKLDNCDLIELIKFKYDNNFINEIKSEEYYKLNSQLLNKLEHKWNLNCVNCDILPYIIKLQHNKKYTRECKRLYKYQTKIIKLFYPVKLNENFILFYFADSNYGNNYRRGVFLLIKENNNWRLSNKILFL